MPGEEIYELYTDSFTPETIPMARLADYMASFAELLGHSEHVHFGKLKAGSLSVTARVDEIDGERLRSGSMKSAMVVDRSPLEKRSGRSMTSWPKITLLAALSGAKRS